MSIEVKNLSHIYNKGTAMESFAVKNVSFTIEDGDFIGVIGHTGSGKSTLIQHLNGLETPTEGTVYFNGEDIFKSGYDLKRLRGHVGIVFQYPEYQLFEESVLKDVMYGPGNMGFSAAECEKKAKDALRMIGLNEEYWDRSPFELSGGEKRRAAIAGILAMEPDVLILDEPTAGLDPQGRNDILTLINRLHNEKRMTVVIVSHSMEDVAEYADKLIVMKKGELLFYDTPKEVFKHIDALEECGLSAPEITYLAHDLKKIGFDIDTEISTVSEAADEIMRLFS